MSISIHGLFGTATKYMHMCIGQPSSYAFLPSDVSEVWPGLLRDSRNVEGESRE